MAKEKDFSIPMFTEAYEQFGVHLDDGRIVVVEGVASRKDDETRLSVTNLKPIESAISQLTEEVTWLIDPDDSDVNSSLVTYSNWAIVGKEARLFVWHLQGMEKIVDW